jgi:hypothetical protein
MNLKKRRGKPNRSEIDIFQAKVWYNTVTNCLNNHSPFNLEGHFQPQNIKRDLDGKLYSSRAWDKYKRGTRSPSDGNQKDGVLKVGVPNLVSVVGKSVPDSEYVFRHLFWRVLEMKLVTYEFVVDEILLLPQRIQRDYIDLTTNSKAAHARSLDEYFKTCPEIYISYDDNPHVSLDHLAMQLMFLKIPTFKYDHMYLAPISANIAKCLGPCSVSPWFKDLYLELFDWLEANIWHDLFDYYDSNRSYGSSSKGWRKTKHDWIYTKFII